MRVGVPQVEARQRDEDAAVVSPAVRWAWGQVGAPGLLPRSLRSGPLPAPVRVLLPERGGRCLLWRLGRSLWSRRTSARRYEQRNERNSQ